MKRLVTKIILSILLHIGWDVSVLYVCAMVEMTEDYPKFFEYISNIANNFITMPIFAVITNIFVFLVFIIKPLEEKRDKKIYWTVSLVNTAVTLLFWFMPTIIYSFRGFI